MISSLESQKSSNNSRNN